MTMAYVPFGGTGHASSRVIFGAAALGRMSQSRADDTIELVRANGVNHFDTASSYGESELRLAPFLSDHRDEVFLATKTRERSASDARAELERSLERLGVDQVDLIQLHNLVEPDEWETAHGANGAVAAMAQARDEGLVRFIGVTGHGTRIPGMHVRSLNEFEFDSVLFPYNYLMLENPLYRADCHELMELCRGRSVAMQTIKSLAIGRWPEGYDGPRFSWYQALSESSAIERAVRYVLSESDLFLNTTSDARLLPVLLEAAKAANATSKPSDQDMQHDVDQYDMTPLFASGPLERI